MGALSGIRVLDFSRYIAGPWAGAMLAELGADVIRVDRIGGSEDRWVAPVTRDGEGAVFLQANRNKRSIALDARTDEGRIVQDRLVQTADVVLSNVPNAALKTMGIDYATLTAIRPDIILANVSSFGPRGPWADRPGFDSVGQAMCGSAYLTGLGDQPFRSPITWVDHMTAVYMAFGIMVALRERDQSGRGQQVDASLLGSALGAAGTYLVEQAMTAIDRTPIGNRGFINGPTDTFATRDGWIVVQVVGNPIFRRWARLMDEPHWLDDARFATDELRGQNGALLSERMAGWCAERTSDVALQILGDAGIPAGPVLSPQETLDHEQVNGMGYMVSCDLGAEGQSASLLRMPLDLSVSTAEIRRPPPAVGEHSHEILSEIGFSAGEIERLVNAGAI